MKDRDDFWDIIINRLDVNQNVLLFSLDDDDFLNVLLGGPCEIFGCAEEHIEFLSISFNYLYKVSKKCNLIQTIQCTMY